MKTSNKANIILLLLTILAISLGCNLIQPAQQSVPTATPPPAAPVAPVAPAPAAPAAPATPAPAATPEPKKAEKSKASGDGCNTTNVVRFKKGAKSGSYGCDFDRGSGNYRHRYVLQAEALQELTVQFTQNDGATYTILGPDGVVYGAVTKNTTKLVLGGDGKWVISVNLDQGVDFGNYKLNILIE